MSSLSQAGRSIMTNEINRAFTKGLYGVDPSQLQRKQQQRRVYQQELRKQAEQAQQRKARQKQKLKEQDEKLQRKIQMDIQRDKQQKQKALKQSKQAANIDSNNNIQRNNTNTISSNINNQFTTQRKAVFNSQSSQSIIPKSPINNKQMNSINRNVQNSMSNYFISQLSQQQLGYPLEMRNVYNYEEERFFQEEIQNRARRFKQTLDRKLDQVYLQLESSKKAHVGENIIDEIKRKLKSNSYVPQPQDFVDLQKSGFNQFQEQFSQFYKIPKKIDSILLQSNDRIMRNLDYESESKFSSRIGNYPQQLNYESRVSTQRKSRGESEVRWRMSGRKNDITKRQALDIKLDATLANIGDIINNQNRMYGE